MMTTQGRFLGRIKGVLPRSVDQWKNIFFVIFFIILLTPQLFEILGNEVVFTLYCAAVLWGVLGRVRIPKSALFGFAFFIIAVAYAIVGISTAAWGNYYKLLLFFSFPFVAEVFFKDFDQKANPWMLTALLLASIYNAVYNLSLNIAIPLVSVMINFHPEYAYLHAGGTLFAFQLLLILMVLIPFFRRSRHQALMLIAVFVSAACLIIFQRAITIFALILFLFLYAVFARKTSSAATLCKAIVIVLILTLSFVFLDKILSWLIVVMPGERIKIRLAGTLQYITSGTDDTLSFSNRWSLYMASWGAFTQSLRNFLFGVGFHLDNVTHEYLMTAGGTGHSELLDAAARFGVLGLAPVFGFFVSLYREMHARYRGIVLKRLDVGMIVNLWFIIILFNALLNGIEHAGAVVIIMVLSRLVLNEVVETAGLGPHLTEARGIR